MEIFLDGCLYTLFKRYFRAESKIAASIGDVGTPVALLHDFVFVGVERSEEHTSELQSQR